jgi:hypothetical protein
MYKNYALLGDDLVIGDFKVYKHYSKIMSLLQVKISLAKSILSSFSKGLEFAKKTLIKSNGKIYDVSPISLKEFSSALNYFPDFIAFCNKYSLKLSDRLKIAGYGYRVLSSCNKNYGKCNLILKNHLLSSFSKINYSDSIKIIPLTHKLPKDLMEYLPSGIYKMIEMKMDLLSNRINELGHLIMSVSFEPDYTSIFNPNFRFFQLIYIRSCYLIYKCSGSEKVGDNRLLGLNEIGGYIARFKFLSQMASKIESMFRFV